MNIFSHKDGTFSQQISAPSSIKFFRSRLFATSLYKMVATTINIWSPKSNRFQRRTLRATLRGVDMYGDIYCTETCFIHVDVFITC